jgi:hypothetical protein
MYSMGYDVMYGLLTPCQPHHEIVEGRGVEDGIARAFSFWQGAYSLQRAFPWTCSGANVWEGVK